MRFLKIKGSQSGHCCFEYTVVDSSKPCEINGYVAVCECFEEKEANLICEALNSYNPIKGEGYDNKD